MTANTIAAPHRLHRAEDFDCSIGIHVWGPWIGDEGDRFRRCEWCTEVEDEDDDDWDDP